MYIDAAGHINNQHTLLYYVYNLQSGQDLCVQVLYGVLLGGEWGTIFSFINSAVQTFLCCKAIY